MPPARLTNQVEVHRARGPLIVQHATFSTGFFDSFGGGNDVGYMDDYSVVANPTPEPSSLMLLGTSVLGCAGLIRRRLRA
jgi:hypothetical protein